MGGYQVFERLWLTYWIAQAVPNWKPRIDGIQVCTCKLLSADFHQGPFENGSNNIGEFLAIVHALALFKKNGKNTAIYSGSETALTWVKNKKCITKLLQDEKNDPP